MKARRAARLLLLGGALFAPAAMAHGEAGWMHALLDGAGVFFTTLQYLLPVLMAALLVRDPRPGLQPVALQLVALGIALGGGLCCLPVGGDPALVGLYGRVYLIALGLLVLFNLRPHAALVLVLILLTGALTGLEARSSVLGDPATGLAAAAGFIFAAVCLYLPVALIAGRHSHGWQRLAIRVAASWIAAIAAIDIAFMLGRSV
jgi:hypothetical protein